MLGGFVLVRAGVRIGDVSDFITCFRGHWEKIPGIFLRCIMTIMAGFSQILEASGSVRSTGNFRLTL